jgi:hypothetical protein
VTKAAAIVIIEILLYFNKHIFIERMFLLPHKFASSKKRMQMIYINGREYLTTGKAAVHPVNITGAVICSTK